MHKVGFDNGTTHTRVNAIYAVGMFVTGSPAEKAMENIAMYGSFDTTANAYPDSLDRLPNSTDTCTASSTPAGCTSSSLSGSLCRALPPSSPDWDKNGDGVPDTYLAAEDATAIKQKIMDAVLDILSRVTSGTAASVLASGEGSGANLVQATYYPKRKFFSNNVDWTGGLQNLWYYIDPRFANSSIRVDDGDRILNLKTDSTHHDYIAQLYFDTNDQKAMAKLSSDDNGDSSVVALVDTVEFETLGNLWEAGKLLWNRSAADRLIYTPLDTSAALTANANKFSASSPNNVATLRPLLNTDASTVGSENIQLATNVINWVRGDDIADYLYSGVTETYRSRTAAIDLNGNKNATDTGVNVNGVSMDESAKVWKLGDIVDSTPRISSWVQLNGYDNIYEDTTYKSFVSSATYTNRGMVFVGANDGMLHAFKLGSLELKWTGQTIATEKARLTGTDLGKEMWAFIPRNVLPYLKYLKDTEYCHIQSVDLTPYVFDASIEAPGIPSTGNYWELTKTVNSWRTILIGGMKQGGACRNSTNTTCTDCVKTPIPNVGYSSYFALDVTDQNNPQLLWEFSNENLGFTSSGPAIVRISSRTAGTTNSAADGKTTDGRFFVVFGSGPTGPIDGPTQKFQGRSDQNLRLFVLDLKTGSPVWTIDTGIANAFAGSLLNSNFDSDLDYQDDAVYIPYVKKCASTTAYCTANTWTDGGVLRLMTNEDLDDINVSATGDTALNPNNWLYSKVIENIGPVTASVTRILNKNTGKLRLYFGTGRYFFRSETGTDDPDTLRTLFGIVEPCYDGSYETVCLDNITSNDLTRTSSELGAVNLTTTAGSSDTEGWYITLEAPGIFTYDENGNGTTADDVARTYNAERVITDPLASSTGVVFFTTYKPYNDLCTIGGKTFIWAVKYDTGAAAGSLLQGTALIQVSTGSIEQVKLSTAFTDKGQRRTSSMEGVPPMAQGLSIMTTPSPVKRVLHTRER
jgi:type IV pilus assembly protein PilY1